MRGLEQADSSTGDNQINRNAKMGPRRLKITAAGIKPFVKTNKNDACDAEAICEAVMRPTMRFASIKSAEQQSVLMLHRARELLVRQRTMLINALRGHCGEFGIVVAQGASKVTELIEMIEDREDERLAGTGVRGAWISRRPVADGAGADPWSREETNGLAPRQRGEPAA